MITLLCTISSYHYIYLATFDNLKSWDIAFEGIFLIEMICKFSLEYIPEDSTIPVRNIKKIAIHYLKTSFVYDLIPLIPLQLLNQPFG